MNKNNKDVIIIGAGGAGMMAAISAAKKGLNVSVLSKVPPLNSHTSAAQGGINAALGNIEKDDWRWHMYDTIKSGDWLADQDAVEVMCKNAKEAINDLLEFGVNFSRDQNGKIYQRVYGGQSTNFGKGQLAHRACAAGDRTGLKIIDSLYQQCLKLNVEFLQDHLIYEILMANEYQACGVASIDVHAGKICKFFAKNIIIATGGYGRIYETNTLAHSCTGDGVALIGQCGIPLKDMEFIQFHPTGLHGTGILISEAARAEGGILLNKHGERFMKKYAPKYVELASRDVVARAIATEINMGNGCGKNSDHVMLSLTHLKEEEIKEKLPNLYESTQKFYGIKANSSPIPVAPSAHYTMGGIPTDTQTRVIKNNKIVKGLHAIGEAACVSVHGANRLGCNSLLDLIIFAKIAIDNLNLDIKQEFIDNDSNLDHIFAQKTQGSCESTENLRIEMQQIMQKNVSMFRNEELMKKSLENLQNIKKRMSNVEIHDKSLKWNKELQDFLELRNMITLAIATNASALIRKESRGAHFRVDFPERNDKDYLHHILISKDLTFTKSEIRMNVSDKNLKSFLPKSRSY